MWLIGLLFGMALVVGPARAAQDAIKDPNGKTLALVLDCNSCRQEQKGADCASGVEDGFHDGAACGQCLLDANFGTRIPYPHDLQLLGYLKDEHGKPLSGEFVKLYLPNTWTVRTRTASDGFFRLMLGATIDRQGPPVMVKLGDRTKRKGGKGSPYALFMLQPDHKPCEVKKD